MSNHRAKGSTRRRYRVIAPVTAVAIAATSVLVAPAASANPFQDMIDDAHRNFNRAVEDANDNINRAHTDFERATSDLDREFGRHVNRASRDWDEFTEQLNNQAAEAQRDFEDYAKANTSIIADFQAQLGRDIIGAEAKFHYDIFNGGMRIQSSANSGLAEGTKQAFEALEAGRDVNLVAAFNGNKETFEELGIKGAELEALATEASEIINAINDRDVLTVVEKLEDHGVIDRRAAIMELKRQGILNTEQLLANMDAGTVSEVESILASLGLGDTLGMLNDTDPTQDYGTGHGLTVIEDRMVTGRMQQIRVQSDSVDWGQSGPAVNVLLPEGYEENPDKDYPVMYLYHGGGGNFREFEKQGIEGMSDDMIIVMPDGGLGGWYTDAENTGDGGNDWGTFHKEELTSFVDQNYRTNGSRAAGGFSMGGYGAMKYNSEDPELFDSVTSFSGPTDMRDRGGVVTHWANLSGAIDNGSITGMYGGPWDEEKVSASNPIENVEAFRDKRVSFFSGNSNDITESSVKSGHNNFSEALDAAGIEHNYKNFDGPHHVRQNDLKSEVKEVEEYLASE